MTLIPLNTQVLLHLSYHVARQIHIPKLRLRISEVEDDGAGDLVMALSCVLFDGLEHMYAIPAPTCLATWTHALLQQHTPSETLCIDIPEVNGGDTAFVVPTSNEIHS